jgi:hypothetical protein
MINNIGLPIQDLAILVIIQTDKELLCYYKPSRIHFKLNYHNRQSDDSKLYSDYIKNRK